MRKLDPKALEMAHIAACKKWLEEGSNHRMVVDATISTYLAEREAQGFVEVRKAMQHAASELAQYASYAEIVGGIHINRAQIREWCDAVFSAAWEQ